MANYFVNLPAAQVPRNALLDLTSINSGLDDMRQQKNINRQRADMLEQRDYARGRDQIADQRYDHDLMSKRAHAISQMEPGPQRTAAWQAVVASHPNRAGLGPEFLDPNSGPGMVAAEYGRFYDPIEKKIKLAHLQAQQASAAASSQQLAHSKEMGPLQVEHLRAQTNALKQKDVFNEAIAGILNGGIGGPPNASMSPTPSQPGPRLIPQSAPGQMPQPGLQNVSDLQGGDPNLIRTQAAPPQAAPQVPMVNTPMGPMPQDRARKIGLALALGGKGEAGKMFNESPNALGKEGANENDKRALNSLEQASRLDSIKAKFKPEYQTYDTAIKMGANSWADSFEATRGMVSPADRQKMAEYTQYRQDSMNNLSAYIKEITGAAMGIQEEGRIREGMPDPKKDSPVQFEAKLNNSIATAKLALARHSFLKANGYDDNTISTLAKNDKLGTIHSLDDMKSIINKRLSQAAEQIKAQNPNITPQALQENLRVIQRREFGI